MTVADARQVRDRRQVRLTLDSDDQVVSPLAGRAARAIGDRDERGLECLQLGDVDEEFFGRGVRVGREKLEAERGRVAAEDVVNVHRLLLPCPNRSKAIYVLKIFWVNALHAVRGCRKTTSSQDQNTRPLD